MEETRKNLKAEENESTYCYCAVERSLRPQSPESQRMASPRQMSSDLGNAEISTNMNI